ncbi:hypothetical protein [Streptomyces sp. NPDC008141]|uniref:hypothetical protein n=1 Tax=Streptomyces sp. NPDC008141 TaxID=3364815 RepID=UPI0036F0571A
MPAQETTTLKTAYADKVAADLAENTAQRERIRAEIEALQAQLATLEADHALLESMSAALGGTTAAVPAPRRGRKKTTAAATKRTAMPAKRSTAQQTEKGTAAPVQKATAASKSAAPAKESVAQAEKTKTASTGGGKGRGLTELIHDHLSAQSEPRTAREISEALAQTHPGRTINDNLVRTTTERLVARSRVHRVKQGATVHYTAITTEAAASEAVEKATTAAS